MMEWEGQSVAPLNHSNTSIDDKIRTFKDNKKKNMVFILSLHIKFSNHIKLNCKDIIVVIK